MRRLSFVALGFALAVLIAIGSTAVDWRPPALTVPFTEEALIDLARPVSLGYARREVRAARLLLTRADSVCQEVAASRCLCQVLGPANERDRVQAAMEGAAHHAFTTDRTPKCRKGDEGANIGNGSGQPTG